MSKTSLAVVLLGVLSCGLLGYLVAGDATSVQARVDIGPAKVAVLDLERVFESSEERAKLEEEMKGEFDNRVAQLEAMKKEIDRLKKEMDLVKAGSDEYKNLQAQVISKGAVLKVEQESAESEIMQQRETYFARMLDNIKRRVREYAENRGLDLVLQTKLTVQRDSPPWESVFYCRPELDITDDIIALLNRK